MTGRLTVLGALVAALAAALPSVAVPSLARAQDAQVVPPPPRPAPAGSEPEPSIEELEEGMIPTLVLPEFRVRVGGGVGLQTSSAAPVGEPVYGRITEEVEWMPPALEFVSFGVGAAQMFGPGPSVYQVGARVGGYAWFCEDAVVRCQGAITLQLGVVVAGGTWFDFSADADLRFLFLQRFELFVRGSFLSFGSNSFLNIVAGAAIAF